MDLIKKNTIDEGKTSAEMQSVKFYENIDIYHNRVDSILRLIQDYFDHRKTKYSKKFMAIRVIDEKINNSTQELSEDIKERIEFWLRNDDKAELEDSIYSIELINQIFFCKIFNFNNNNIVLAGYILKESALVRTFISKFSEKHIQEKYEKILEIL